MKQELTTSKIVGEQEKKDRRSGKGRVIALSRRVYRLRNTDVFYVESESSDNIYYFVKYKVDVLEWCSCMDNSTRHKKCKHLFGIEFAIRMDTLKDTDRLPADAKRDAATNTIAQDDRSYEDDDYSF
jgi:predicted nucleic acid-binding Zn finger protein